MQLAPIAATPAPGFRPMTVGSVLEGFHPGAASHSIVSTGLIAQGLGREDAIAIASKLSLGADKPGLAVAMLGQIGTYQVLEIGLADAKTGAAAAYHFEGIEHMAGAMFPFSNLRREVIFVDGGTVFGQR